MSSIALMRGWAFYRCWGLLLLLLLLLLGCQNSKFIAAVQAQQVSVGLQEGEVSYVIEPFEWFNVSEWIMQPGDKPSRLNVSLTNEQEGGALFGDFALCLQYDLDEGDVQQVLEVGLVQPRTPHNCHGSSHVSIWYKWIIGLLDTPVQARLILLDDDGDTSSNANANANANASSMEHYYIDIPPPELLASNQELQDWQELRVQWEDLQLTRTSAAATGNARLDLERLRGWKVELTGTNTGTGGKGTLLLDQLSCIGEQDMISAFFYPGDFATAAGVGGWDQDGIWEAKFYRSQTAANMSQIVLNNDDGTIHLDYEVEMTEAWGGFTSLDSLAPGPAYYNLSQVNYLHLGYRVRVAANPSGRTHLRVMLADSSNVCGNCSELEDWEWWYNFNYVLDEPNGTVGHIDLPLIGGTNSSMPFWLTGWAGGVGNRQFDKEYIKGFNFQLSVDSEGQLGSMVTGAIDLFNFSAYYLDDSQQAIAQEQSASTSNITTIETDMIFTFNSPRFEGQEFLASRCRETCAQDPNCLYAYSILDRCFTAGFVESEDVLLPNTVTLQETVTTFWMDDATKRGNFCDKCHCQEEDRSIDCRGQDLFIAPKTFDLPWKPRSLDLRNNSRLVLLGKGSLDEIAQSLEEIWLPKEMRFVSQECLDNLSLLTAVHSEEEEENNSLDLINAIENKQDAFGDVCCSIGRHLELNNMPSKGISFCDMTVKTPGVDSTYFAFTKFDDATPWAEVRPSSKFMAEAAESPQKCAEYCSISKECNYFAYDGRVENAEHICYLLEDIGNGPLEVCCDEDHFADEAKTIPGWTSGLPPRTRHTADDARVLIEPHTIALQTNLAGYGEAYFDLRLGSMPLRGAVWIEPEIASSTPVTVAFDPPRVVLYDTNTTVRVHVKISAADIVGGREYRQHSVAFVIQNHITSCDLSFMEFEDDSMATRETTVFVDVAIPKLLKMKDESIHPGFTVAIVALCLAFIGLMVYLWMKHKRKQMDAVWIIKTDELTFPQTPVVLGRGSFGLVLRAEYRGSDVAVKRALPSVNVRNSRRQSTSESEDQFMPSESAGTTSGSIVAMPSAKVGPCCSSTDGMDGSSPVIDRHSWSRMKKNFMAEMRQLSSLRHPCITTVMGAVLGQQPQLVMELMDHGSLYDLLSNETVRLDPEVVLPMLLDISQGLRFLHSSKPQVIHGDLKAANILVDKRFRAKVADFGMSGRKATTGTPFWMAPELILGSSPNTTASDVYAFGMILYEVYSRKDPYEEDLEKCSSQKILQLVADEAVSKRPPTPKDMPAPVASMMIECFVHDPEERPTFEEIDKRLRRVNVKSLDGSVRSSSRNVSLFDIFPKDVAEALQDGREVEATHKECVTIFFSDIVGFTDISAELEPRKVADLLGRLYTQFDELSHKHQIYKVETIGDAYMAVANLVEEQESDHAARIARFAIDAIAAAKSVPIDSDDLEKGCVNIRVGFHSGPVVADVVGTRNPRFCLFGDSVNTASRMESSGEAGRIHCSKGAATLLELQCPTMPMDSRGIIDVKGKGRQHTYWVNEEGIKPSQKNGSGHIARGASALDASDPDLAFYSTHTANFVGKSSGRWRNDTTSQEFSERSGNTKNEFALE